ncbi:MAG TPA: Gfo/Idh/MocA family oxidoreductase [Luteolibacter sp.]|nr:Gfo/Idh/MocA family oxidoreductase [Luteolibacter sp.]
MTTRREFLRTSSLNLGLLAATGALSSRLAAQNAAGAKPSLGVALVGLGSYATRQLLPALRQTKHCHLAGIVTGTPEKAIQWQKDHGVKAANVYDYKSYDRIADNPEIDIVYVVLPNSMHAEYTIRALKAGKHVICEKPMGLSVAECDQMLAAAKQAGKTLAIGYRLHYDPFHQEAKRVGQEQVLGKVKLFEGGFGFRAGDPTQWRLRKALAGGGAIMDVGIYVMQAARYCTGEEPVSVTAQEIKTDSVKFAEVDETVLWQMKFPSGAMASCTTSYNCSTDFLQVACENGRYRVSPSYGYQGMKGEVNGKPMEFTPVNQQAMHMDGIARHILNGEPLLNVGGDEGRRDMLIIEAIYRAIASGREETVAR